MLLQLRAQAGILELLDQSLHYMLKSDVSQFPPLKAILSKLINALSLFYASMFSFLLLDAR